MKDRVQAQIIKLAYLLLLGSVGCKVFYDNLGASLALILFGKDYVQNQFSN